MGVEHEGGAPGQSGAFPPLALVQIVPVAVMVGTAKITGGTKEIPVLRVESVNGSQMFGLDPDQALGLCQQLRPVAMKCKTGLDVPIEHGELILPTPNGG